MADTKKNTAQAATGEKAKAKRVIGPRTAWLIFKPGTDPALVESVKNAIDEVTLSSRSLLKALQGGTPAPFLSYTVHVEPREGEKAN